jgi:Ca2+-binding RTX toxin-like protein
MANIDGTPIGETLTGTSGADVIRGFGGNDILIGLEGADQLEGGIGDDTYYIDNPGDLVIELAGQGFDAIYTSVSYALAAGSEVEWLSASTNYGIETIHLTGNELANLLIANEGDSVLNGGGGADVMIGLGGHDVYYVDNVGDQVRESAGGGYDAVYTSVSYTLAAGAEVEWLSSSTNYGAEAIALTGNELANVIIANEGTNVLNGGGGADILIGYGGNDAYYVDNAADQVREAAGGGFDAVYTTVSYGLAAGTEVEWLSTSTVYGIEAISLTGNEYNNYLLANEGANLLNGAGGADVMIGYGGNDTYIVDSSGDVVVGGAPAGGFDDDRLRDGELRARRRSRARMALLALTPSTAPARSTLSGNEFGQFRCSGNAGANILDGKGGNDAADRRAGADTFAFTTALGGGNVDTITDFVAGTDKIQLGGGAGQPFAQPRHRRAPRGHGRDRHGRGSMPTTISSTIAATGALLYDADGNGGGAAVQFATLSTGLSLTAADFLVSGAANNAPAITFGRGPDRREQPREHDRLPGRRQRRRRRPDHLFADRHRRRPADDRRQWRGPADHPRRFRDQDDLFVQRRRQRFGRFASKAVTLTITDVADTASTPIINETAAANDSTGTAQAIDRGTFVIAANPTCPTTIFPRRRSSAASPQAPTGISSASRCRPARSSSSTSTAAAIRSIPTCASTAERSRDRRQ